MAYCQSHTKSKNFVTMCKKTACCWWGCGYHRHPTSNCE